MLKEKYIILIGFCLCLMMSSCTDELVLEDNPTLQQYDLVFSVGRQAGMRMANEVVQAEGEDFRGMQDLLALPFETSNATAVTTTDLPSISTVKDVESEKVNDYYYYIVHCSLAQGTNRMLVYGQAKPLSGKESPAQNGKLVTTLVDRMSPGNITFSLQPVYDTTDEIPTQAQELANYLTAIANTEGWSTTTEPWLKNLYLKFINIDPDGTGLIAGSAVNVKAYVNSLEVQLGEDDLSTAIKASINSDAKSCLTNDYPGSLGLPDGAAALRWTGSSFSVRTLTTTLDNINNINRYTYPAELWYYANSAIRTSTKEVSETSYSESGQWENLLNTYYTDSHFVVGETKSVAIKDPLQYGVGRLKMTLETIEGELLDSKGISLDYENDATKLPMTAVIVGGQHTVGFDFKPIGEQSDVDARFIYDTVVGTTGTVNTLVLQSYDGEKVPIILEFQNNTEHSFAGKDGIIYPNTKFYLVGQLDPANATNKDAANVAAAKERVFTQDYTTVVTTRVTSLANAYSCLPDLLQPRLEIGIQVQTKWIQSTPTTVKL